MTQVFIISATEQVEQNAMRQRKMRAAQRMVERGDWTQSQADVRVAEVVRESWGGWDEYGDPHIRRLDR